MPNQLNTLFNILVLVIQWQSRQDDGTKQEAWNALLLITSDLSHIQCRTKRAPTNNDTKCKRASITPTAVKSPFGSLPAELISLILDQITDQKTLHSLSLANRRWNRFIKPRLYINPYVTSPKSIESFVNSLDDTNRFGVRKIEFGPSQRGCLSSADIEKDHFEFIPFVHSGLFRVLIYDRDTEKVTENIVHPIFYQLSKLVPNCDTFEEYGYHKEVPGETTTRKEMVFNRSFSLTRIPSSSMNLTLLLRACHQWHKEFPEWNGLKASIPNCISTCTLLLEWLQGTYHPIWHRIGSAPARDVKPLINSLVRNLLGHVYTTLLLQVRFVTSNSQRLLDSYCLMYYRVLSFAQTLDLIGLADAMGCSISDESSNRISENLLMERNSRVSESESFFAEVLPETKISITPKSVRSSIESIGLSTNQDTARSIYECLILIFHLRIPANLYSSKTTPHVPIEVLKDILVTFPPSSINAETIELITWLLEHKLDPTELTTPLLESWFRWFKEIILWHDASREMDPVKELLRKSMAKIDHLRTVQVFFIHVASIRSCFYGIRIINVKVYYKETPVFLKFRITTMNFM
jgi:hypothetical protein